MYIKQSQIVELWNLYSIDLNVKILVKVNAAGATKSKFEICKFSLIKSVYEI